MKKWLEQDLLYLQNGKKEYLSLTSNPDYFAGKPQVDGVFSIFTNRDTMVQSLLNGETDVALGLYPSQLDSLKKMQT